MRIHEQTIISYTIYEFISYTIYEIMTDNENDDQSRIDTVSRSSWPHSADDVTVDYWRRHNNCDACTWKVISNSLDIDFIHGNIHGW